MPSSFLFASTGLAAGQATTTGSVSGEITDSTGAVLPGVTVTVSNNQGTKVFVSGRSGGYLAPFLTPGIYAFEVELQGFRSVEQTGVVVGLGQTIELDFVMSVGSVTERVQVTGASPVVDVQATSAGGLLYSEVLKHLPVGRNFTQTLYLVPGVSSSGQVGDQNPAISGASGLENQYVVDGVNITNTGYGGVGSYSIVFGSLGNGVTTDFIQETQVQTAGFEAEYGQATGGVVNVITKSGSNLFSGSAYGFVRAGGTEGDWKNLQTPNGTVNTTERSFADVGVTAGGRLVEDRLFFFGALNPQWQNRTFVAPDGFPLVGSGPQERKRRIYSYAGKLTYQAAAAHRIDASFFGDPSEGLNGLQRASGLLAEDLAPRISALDTYGAHNQVVKYDAILSSNFLFEASFARNDEEFAETPALQEWAVTDRTVVPSVRTGGFGFYERGTKGLSLQYQVKATNLIDGGNGGTHQVRYGVAYEDINYDRLINRTGPTFTLHNGATTLTGASVSVLNAPELAGGKLWRVTRANTSSNQNATTQQYVSFFAQDTWQVGNLTVRPGVRYEQQDLRGDPDTPLCREGETRPGRGDGSGALKPCSFKWDGNWAARVGTSYDLIGDGRSKLYANWGRFYAKIPNDLAARAMSADAAATRADYADANLTMPIQTGTVAGGTTVHFRETGLHAAEIDPDSRSTFKDEFATGVEFEALPAVNVGFRYIYRNMTQVLEDVGQTTLTDFYSNPAAAFASVEYFITNHQPDHEHVGQLGHGPIRGAGPQLPRVRGDGEQAAVEQLGADLVVSILASAGDLRGLLPERQRAVRPGDHVALRLPDQLGRLHPDRRPAVRVPRRHPEPGCSGFGPAAE